MRKSPGSLIERVAKASRGYRLIGIRAGSRVSETDKYRRWHIWHHEGTILRLTVNQVTVQWDGDDEFSYYSAEEARYRVDTNRWRIVLPKQARRSAALTSVPPDGMIASSPHSGVRMIQEEVMGDKLTAGAIGKMTLPQLREAASKVFDEDELKGLRKVQLVGMLTDYYDKLDEDDDELDDVDPEDDELDEDIDDELELDEPEPPKKMTKSKVNDAPAGHKPDTSRQTPPEPNGDTLTAKQVATRIGTDAKTLRKFFRGAASTVEPVGQGGRYEFAKDDLEKIRTEFETWKSGAARTRTKPAGPASTKAKPSSRTPIVEELDDEELELDDEEPTTADLDELDDLELDDELDD